MGKDYIKKINTTVSNVATLVEMLNQTKMAGYTEITDVGIPGS